MSEFRGNTSAEAAAAAAQGGSDFRAGGFDFENCLRNNMIEQMAASNGTVLPKFKKTGTTICGAIFDGGVVLGADTRATEGSIVCDKNCEKIHYIAPNIYCCGAGTSADTENTTALISSQLDLLRLSTGVESRVVTAMTMLKRMLFRYQGHVSAALVLGGVDKTGAHLYTVYPHGSTDKLPFVTMGSGSLAAMAVMEAEYKDNMNEAEAVELVKNAILSGIFNDLGSGSNVDVMVLRHGGEVKYHRNMEMPNNGADLRKQVQRPPAMVFPQGATAVLKKEFEPITNLVDVTVTTA